MAAVTRYEDFVDNRQDTLSASASAGATSFTLTSGTGFPSGANELRDWTMIFAGTNELVPCHSRNGNVVACNALINSYSAGQAVKAIIDRRALLALPSRFAHAGNSTVRPNYNEAGMEPGSFWYDTDLKTVRMSDPVTAAVVQVTGTAPAVKANHSASQNTTTGVPLTLALDSTDYDLDASGAMHNTASGNVPGTINTTSGDGRLFGTGTNFTTDLVVGQVVNVPQGRSGNQPVHATVTAILSATQVSTNVVFNNTASGQTISHVNGALVARTPGVYSMFGHVEFAAVGAGQRRLNINYWLPSTLSPFVIASHDAAYTNIAGVVTRVLVFTQFQLAAWDCIELEAFQDSGSTIAIASSYAYTPRFGMAWLRSS